MANILTKFKDYVEASLDSRIEELKKTEEPLEKGEKVDGTVGRKGLLFDPWLDNNNGGGLFKPRTSYISPAVLKQVSRRDPIVATIIDTRASQCASFAKRPASRFEMGFKLVTKDKDTEANSDEVRRLEEFILNCGQTENRTPEDKMTFDSWIYAVIRDFLVYGHAAIEKVRRKDGSLFSFLPLAAETIYYANKKVGKGQIDQSIQTWEKMIDPNKVELNKMVDGDYSYLQVMEGKVTEGFTSQDLIFAKLNTETDYDLQGYCMGPLERVLSAIISHLNIENHQRQWFTHGLASRGVFVIEGDVTPNQLRTFQQQWQAGTGPLSAWKTPVIAGVKGASFISLATSNRDMEFAEYMRHTLTVIFGGFAMDPEEAGFGYLSKGVDQKSLSESSNEWKIEASRDRGLRPMLNRICQIMNEDILPSYSEKIAKKYHFEFVGLDADTPQEELQRLQAETQLHTSLNEARKQAEMTEMELGGGLVLNPLLISTLQSSMPFGLFVEKFIGIPGASQRPDLQFFANPMWFQWQQTQMQMMQQQAAAQVSGQPGEQQPAGDGQEEEQESQEGAQGEEPSAEQQDAMMAQQQAMAQAQASAVQQYIASNPELFKALNTAQEDLKKSVQAPMRLKNTHVEKMTNRLVKEWRSDSEQLIKDILKVVAEDVKAMNPKKDS